MAAVVFEVPNGLEFFRQAELIGKIVLIYRGYLFEWGRFLLVFELFGEREAFYDGTLVLSSFEPVEHRMSVRRRV